jgi:hypothetical protein
MRLAMIASALAIVVCLAVFGAIALQKISVSGPAPSTTPVENAADHYNPHWRWQLPSSPLLKADRHDPHWRWRR